MFIMKRIETLTYREQDSTDTNLREQGISLISGNFGEKFSMEFINGEQGREYEIF